MPAVTFLRMTAECVGADASVRPNGKRCISGRADTPRALVSLHFTALVVGPTLPLKSLALRGGLKTGVFL